MHAGVEVNPDAEWKKLFEGRSVPDCRTRKGSDRCCDFVFYTEGQDIGAKSRNLVALVDLDAFCSNHSDAV